MDEAIRGTSYRLDPPHWSRLYLTFRAYFRTPRDVARYCNHVRSPMRLLGEEVEAADVLTLEALRLFERPFWGELPQLVRELTSTGDHPGLFSNEPRPREQRLREAIDACQQPETVREIVRELFPAAARYLGGSSYGSDFLPEWQRQRRVAHPAVLQLYLSKQLQPTEVPTPLVERIVGELVDANALRREFSDLNSEQLIDLLSRLEAFEKDFPADVAPAIPVLYEFAPRLPSREGMLDLEPEMRITRVVLRLLRTQDEAQVVQVVESSLPLLPLLGDRWSLIRLVGHREGSGHRLVPEQAAQKWQRELAEEVLAAKPGELAAEPELSRLIALAREHDEHRTEAKLRSDADDDQLLLSLLASYKGEVRSDTGRHIQLRWDSLADLLGEERLVRRVLEASDLEARAQGDALEMVAQARRYAADPRRAHEELAQYRQRYG